MSTEVEIVSPPVNMLVGKLAGTAKYIIKKHGPAILTAAGVGGFIATTYLTGKSVLKSQEKVKAFKLKQEELMSREETAEYTRNQKGRDLAELWYHDGAEILKDFAPALTVGSISIICIVSSHTMMRNKHASLVAAYTALDQGFKAYRKRIENEFGPDKEMEVYRGVRFQPPAEDADPNLPCEIDFGDVVPSPYAKFFDEYNVHWTKTPEYNLLFLRSQMQYANDRLQAYGFVFLNEVYEWLGLPRTQAGQVVGWRRDAKDRGTGDGFIDFGIYNLYEESSRAFVNGNESSLLLDFNVDGPITI